MHYWPIALPFLLVLWALFALFIGMVQIGLLEHAFDSMGLDRRYMFSLILLSLVGSCINIPITELPAEPVRSGGIVEHFGMWYVVPMLVRHPGTVLAVNVGGAIIPIVLSIYLMIKNRLFVESFIAVGFVAVTVHALARPVPGVGIAVPTLIPPIITAVVALFIMPWRAGPLAYIAGSLGTLIGADLLNLGKVRGLGAPVASIGGAGKFDAIFLTGLVAVLIAGLLGGRPRVRQAN